MLYYNNITKKYENINISDYKNDIHFYELLLKNKFNETFNHNSIKQSIIIKNKMSAFKK